MDLELVSRTAPKDLCQPNLQQLDTSDIRCITRQCSGPTAFPHLHQRPRQWHSQQNIQICWWHKTLSQLKTPWWGSWITRGCNQASDWGNIWQMNLNIDKCAIMHIGHNNIQHNYTTANQQLITTEEQRDLGITITRDIKWHKQTEKHYKTANRVLWFIAHNLDHPCRRCQWCVLLGGGTRHYCNCVNEYLSSDPAWNGDMIPRG